MKFSKALAIAQHNSNFLPRSFSVEEMERDVALLESLLPILVSLTRLQEQLQDTYIEAGSEAYAAALVIYHSAHENGEGESLEALLDDLGQRFARKSRGQKQGPTGGGGKQ